MKNLAFIVVFFLFAMSGCALRSDVVYLDGRIDSVEKKISLQKTSSEETAKQIRQDYAKLSNDYEALSDRVRQLQGNTDEANHKIQKTYSSSDKLKSEIDRMNGLIADLSKRINLIESYTGANDAASATKSPDGSLTTAIVDPDATTAPDVKLYNDSKKALDKGDTKTARNGFTRYIKDYPNSKTLDNAQFWIGESYYQEKWYQKAILEYQKVIETYPKSGKVAASYLKQGLSFIDMGEAGNGKLVLNQLIKKFPNSSEAAIAKKKLVKIK